MIELLMDTIQLQHNLLMPLKGNKLYLIYAFSHLYIYIFFTHMTIKYFVLYKFSHLCFFFSFNGHIYTKKGLMVICVQKNKLNGNLCKKKHK